MIANLDVPDFRADGDHVSDELMTDDRSGLHAAKMAGDDMQVGSTNSGQRDTHQGVGRIDEDRLRRLA